MLSHFNKYNTAIIIMISYNIVDIHIHIVQLTM